MNRAGVADMAGTTPGGTAEHPQAEDVEARGELVNGTVWPRAVLPHEWQNIITIVGLLTTHKEGRVATGLYEVSRDDIGCIHIIIGRPLG